MISSGKGNWSGSVCSVEVEGWSSLLVEGLSQDAINNDPIVARMVRPTSPACVVVCCVTICASQLIFNPI